MRCTEIALDGNSLPWVNEAKYLGIFIKNGKSFSCNWSAARRNYYIAINNIFGTLGHDPQITVLLSLAKSNCFPLLTYGIAAISLPEKEIRNFSFAYGGVFNKLFKVCDAKSIEQCQYYCSCLPFSAFYDYLRYCFLAERVRRGNLSSANPFDKEDSDHFACLALKYNLQITDSKSFLKYKIWKVVESSLL